VRVDGQVPLGGEIGSGLLAGGAGELSIRWLAGSVFGPGEAAFVLRMGSFRMRDGASGFGKRAAINASSSRLVLLAAAAKSSR